MTWHDHIIAVESRDVSLCWLVPSVIAAIFSGLVNAWVLLVGILR